MKQRNAAITIVLMAISCGLYAMYYTWETTKELAQALGKTEINVGMETVINLVSCGLFGVYAEYRNQQLIDRWYEEQGIAHEPKAQTIGLMNLLGFVVGVTWFVAVYIHIEELNELAKVLAERGQPGAGSGAPLVF